MTMCWLLNRQKIYRNQLPSCKLLYDKGTRAMFKLLRRDRQLQVPLEMMHLFDTLVKPILLYDSEICAHEGTEILENIH